MPLLFLYNHSYFYLFDCTNFVPTAGLVIPTEVGNNESNEKIETQTVIAEAKIINC